MTTLLPPPRLTSAAVVFYGPQGAVTQQAARRGVPRQTLYREADAVLRALDPLPHEKERAQLQRGLAELRADCARLQQQLASAVVLGADQQAEFAATAQALGVSLSAARALLAVLLGAAAPSTAALGRLTRAAGRRAGCVLTTLDPLSRGRARQVAADEVFSGRRPVLMTVEQDSLCWLGGRLADDRDGETWAGEFAALTAAAQVTADGGVGLHKGLALANARRRQAGLPPLAEQRDHFHVLHRARRALCTARCRARGALRRAERLQQAYDQAGRAGRPRSPAQGRQLHRAWAGAEQAFDDWSAQEAAARRLQTGLRLVTPQGELNTRAQAEAEAAQALAGQTGPDWARARRLLGPEAFTFLDRAQQELDALPVAAELRQAAMRVEGLRQRPELLRGESASARAARGVLLAAGLVLALAGEAGQRARELVRGVLRGAWRSSSSVEGINSALRMRQARQKRLTQGLLDLQRLYWNLHPFVAGRRKGTHPYGRLGLTLPAGGWWAVLNMPPEQLQQQLSALNPAA